jgi:hypothetical protein
MNGRIKELSRQAWEWAEQQEYKDATQEFSDILEQKFAELIIQECIGVADHSNVTGKSIIGQRIKEHFEIERPKKVVYPKLLPRKFPEDEE